MTTTSKRWVFIAIFLALAVIAALISTKYYSSAAGVNTGGRALKRDSVQVSPEPYKPAQKAVQKKAVKSKTNKTNKKGASPEPYKPQSQKTRGSSPEPYKAREASPEPYEPVGSSPEPYNPDVGASPEPY